MSVISAPERALDDLKDHTGLPTVRESPRTLAPDRHTLRAPNAVFFPVFSAFRAYLREVDGKYEWWDGESPTDWSNKDFEEACQRLALKMAKAIRDKDKLNAVGRDPQVWATCYETLNSYLFETGRKKTR